MADTTLAELQIEMENLLKEFEAKPSLHLWRTLTLTMRAYEKAVSPSGYQTIPPLDAR